ncbi:STAS domain-containing protein [Bosea sp. Root381]|uniref:STAS domain-containing protein n=1 Tax=Bosea sp. Root381 TaxID=1736524 RepID=UPI0012E39B68|nr:STAS domain-containing protein [Bosea sp. Root381]
MRYEMSSESVGVVTRVGAGSDCTLRNARALTDSLVGLVNAGSGVEVDCSDVAQVDITFVQTIVSAERSFAARDLSFAMLAAPECVHSAFARAGIAMPGTGRFEPSRN